MKIEYIEINKVIPYENNPRINNNAIDKVAESIKRFGFKQPIVIDKNNIVVAGHTRLEASKKLGLDKVPCLYADDLTESQIKAYRLADNKTNEFAEWDMDKLQIELQELNDLEFNMSDFGFEEIEEEKEIEEDNFNVDENINNIENIKTKVGYIYKIGNHTLMCGDSTKKEDVNKLLDGNKIDIVFTDPPYGIDEETNRIKNRSTYKKSGLAKQTKYNKIIGDTTIETAEKCYEILDKLCDIIIYWGGNYYNLKPSSCWLVWDKRVEEKQKNNNSDCELAYIKHKTKKSVRIFRHLWKGMIKDSEHGEHRVHPTQKPIQLAVWCFDEYKKDSKNILDLFGGSGSTLIACEQTNRNCFMMELDEKYCDAIVKRWEKYTGKKAELINEI
jgi:site-specific DNA-methyltransferase (adenine-specific)